MKRNLLLSYFLFIVFVLQAQPAKIEMRAGAGYLSDAHFAAVATNEFFSLILPFINHDYAIHTSGIYSADVLFRLKDPHLQIGASYTREKLITTNYTFGVKTSYSKEINGIMPALYYNYVLERNYFYSGINLGVKLHQFEGSTDNADKIVLAYHITALGFHFGNKIAGFGEIGFGAKGFLRAGISMSF